MPTSERKSKVEEVSDRVGVESYWPSGRKQIVTTGLTPNTTLRITEPGQAR